MIELIQYRWGSSRPDRRRSAQGTKFPSINGQDSESETSIRQRIRETHFQQKRDPNPDGRATSQ